MEDKKKKKKKVIIFVAILAAIVIAAVVLISIFGKKPAEMVSTVEVETRDLENSVSFSGTVESKVFQKVASAEDASILAINVKEGDKVKKGDVLATLNTKDLENEIAQQKATIEESGIKTDYTVSDAEKKYEEAKRQIDEGTYSELLSAKTALDNAKTALDNAQVNYDTAIGKQGTNRDDTLVTAQKAVETAQQALNDAKRTVDTSKNSLDKQSKSLQTSKKNYEEKQRLLKNAQDDLATARREKENEDYSSIITQKRTVESTREAYEDGLSEKEKRILKADEKSYEELREKYYYLAQTFESAHNRSVLADPDFWKEHKEEPVTSDQVKEAKKKFEEMKNTIDDLTKEYDDKKKQQKEKYYNAVEDYAIAKAKIDINHDKNILSAIRTVQTNEASLETEKLSYDSAKISYESVKIQYDQDKEHYDNKKLALEEAKTALSLVSLNNKDAAVKLQQELSDKKIAYAQAQEKYNVALDNANSSLASLKAEADKQRVLSNTNDPALVKLRTLEERLEKCVITAPCDGTVTKVYAVLGQKPSSAQGGSALFIIEDTDNLRLSCVVNEYNAASLTSDADVVITVPALDSKTYKGKITTIAPAAVKNSEGKSDGAYNFEVSSDIYETSDTAVRIGMSAKGKMISSSKDNALSVSYDCIGTDENGKSFVAVAQTTPKGSVAHRIPVERGFESDAFVEIISAEITDGTKVIINPENYTEGQAILVMPD